jgi:hypothetical protein
MLYYSFKNYEEFKELFGITVHGNGAKSRKNKILLAFLKQKNLLHKYVKGDIGGGLFHITNMSALYDRICSCIAKEPDKLYSDTHMYKSTLMGIKFHSSEFRIDGCKGVCEDMDSASIRYVRLDNDRVYKMRAGKFMRKVLLECVLAERGILCEQVINWFCEEFARNWESYAISQLPELKLVVDDNFHKIYSSSHLAGYFNSCMVGKDVEDFYKNYVEARAASLLNNEDKIVARCVIFDECTNKRTGEVLRLAERQYSLDSSDLYKQVLVNKLIAAGEIDGYKRVGADCHSPQSFLRNNGECLSYEVFFIPFKHDLVECDFIPYMDSFKYYDEGDNIAYNSSDMYYDEELTETDGHPLSNRAYDEWNEEWCDSEDLCTVYCRGREYQTNCNRLDDFRWVEDEEEYHYYDDVAYCECCDKYVLIDNAYYSELTGEYYCCDSCFLDAETNWYEDNDYVHSDVTCEWYETEEDMEEAEQKYKERYWHYSEVLDKYFEYRSWLERAEKEYFEQNNEQKNEEEEK